MLQIISTARHHSICFPDMGLAAGVGLLGGRIKKSVVSRGSTPARQKKVSDLHGENYLLPGGVGLFRGRQDFNYPSPWLTRSAARSYSGTCGPRPL